MNTQRAFLLAFLILLPVVGVRAADDLAPLSDEFDNPATLSNFLRLHLVEGWGAAADKVEVRDINTSRAGRFVVIPYTSTWFQNYVGELSFKEVTGDFVITTEVIPRNRAQSGPPGRIYSLGGIMVRAPTGLTTGAAGWQSGQQNYVFLSMGAASSAGTYQFEVKTTVNSSSSLVVSNAAVSQAEIQVARLGTSLIMLRRDNGGSWIIHRRYSRPDFPSTLQAGITVYTDYGGVTAVYPAGQEVQHNATHIAGQNPDLRAEFEYLRYARPQIPVELAGMNFSNPAQVSDAQLLSFLGANAGQAPAAGSPGTLQFAAATYSVAEGAGSVAISVTRSGGSAGVVGITHTVAAGTASSADFTPATGTLAWADGDAVAKSFNVALSGDALVEGAETIALSLSDPSGGATLGSPASATLTIADDDLPPFVDDLAVISDEFNRAGSLSNFQRLHLVEGWGTQADKLEVRDINTSSAGRFVMIPYASTWYQNYVGELSFKEVTGDFVITTLVIPRNRAQTGPPNRNYSLGGIMVRAASGLTTGAAGWQTGRQNYVFLSMGAANTPGSYQFEVKTTVNSASTLITSNTAVTQAEIQVARLGTALIMLRRDNGGQWLVHRRYARADFPATLQAGLTVYTDFGGVSAVYPAGQEAQHNATHITGQNPDLRAEFEYLRYRRPQIPANLAGRDFSNPAQVSDAELLSFLGANADRPGLITQPASQVVPAGDTVTFQVEVTGDAPWTYQWQRNGTNLPGATGASLQLTGVSRAQAGDYTLGVTNGRGGLLSHSASLRVLSPQRLEPPQPLADRAFRLLFGDHEGVPLGAADAPNFEVYVSTNLVSTNWLRLTNSLTLTNGMLFLDDVEATNHPLRFYRVIER
jgi:hypothetical protein